MLRGSAHVAPPSMLWISSCAAPSEASTNSTQDRQRRAKIFLNGTGILPVNLERAKRPSSCSGQTALGSGLCEWKMTLSRTLFVSVRCHFGRSFSRRGQLHPNKLAHAALLHCNSVKHIRLRYGALVVCHDDKLALGNESFEHTDETVDVAFIERRINFIQNAKRARPNHVDRKQ